MIKTMGDVHPSLLLDPRHAELAARPYPWPPDRPGPAPINTTIPITVGIFCPCLNMGGAEMHQLSVARHADPSRVRFAGCCVVGGHGHVDPKMLAATREVMPVTASPEAARVMARDCDVILSWAIDDLPEILDGLPNRPRVVSVIHAPPESPWGQTVYAKPDGIDRWVAVSELALGALPEHSRTIPSSVIWNAVDPGRMVVRRSRDEVRAAWGVPPGAKVAGYLGRMASEKNVAAMFELAPALPEPWWVVIVGNGDRWQGAIPDRLHIVGNDPAAGDVLNAFDVLVVPSLYESFGLTIAEGLVSGLPVVSTDVGVARLAPGSTRIIPFNASGPELARQVFIAYAEGPRPAARSLLPRLGIERFGREWTDLLCGMVEGEPEAPAKPPGLVKMAGTFAKAMSAQAVHMIQGGECYATPEVVAERERLCFSCSQLDKTKDSCNACGCGVIGALSFVGLDLKLKRSLATSRCPLLNPRWGAMP